MRGSGRNTQKSQSELGFTVQGFGRDESHMGLGFRVSGLGLGF